jgi:hypothetical protein
LLAAYLPAGEATNLKGETYTRYAPCQMCEGIGELGKWISPTEFLEKLTQSQAPARQNISRQNTACLKGT